MVNAAQGQGPSHQLLGNRFSLTHIAIKLLKNISWCQGTGAVLGEGHEGRTALPKCCSSFEKLFPMLQTDSLEISISFNCSWWMYTRKTSTKEWIKYVSIWVYVHQQENGLSVLRENSGFHLTNIRENIVSSNHCRHAADLFAQCQICLWAHYQFPIIMRISLSYYNENIRKP